MMSVLTHHHRVAAVKAVAVVIFIVFCVHLTAPYSDHHQSQFHAVHGEASLEDNGGMPQAMGISSAHRMNLRESGAAPQFIKSRRFLKRGDTQSEVSDIMSQGASLQKQRQQQRLRQVVQTASVAAQVEEGELANAIAAVHRIVESVQGYTSAERAYSTPVAGCRSRRVFRHCPPPQSSASLTLRVPAQALDVAVQQIAVSVGKTLHIRRRATEVSADMDDLSLQLAQVQRERQLFEGLYNDSIKLKSTLTETLSLLERMMTFEDTIVRLQDALQRMKRAISYATIELSITEVRDSVNVSDDELFVLPIVKTISSVAFALYVASWCMRFIVLVVTFRILRPFVADCLKGWRHMLAVDLQTPPRVSSLHSDNPLDPEAARVPLHEKHIVYSTS